jgi:hypothetical protein
LVVNHYFLKMRARGSSSVRRDEQPTHAAVAAALALGGIAAGTFLWRTLAWPPRRARTPGRTSRGGEALLRGERPAFDLTSTIPKPLATVLGALASPLPPEQAMGVVVALAFGVLVAALFVARRDVQAPRPVSSPSSFSSPSVDSPTSSLSSSSTR